MNKNLTKTIFLLTCLAILFFFIDKNESHSAMRSKNKILAGTPPFEIIKQIIRNNEQKVQHGQTITSAKFAPYITWLTDPDARIQPRQILDNPYTKIYSCRNLGGQLELSSSAIDYGIRHLHTPILLITLNSDNRAIRYFVEGYAELTPSLRRDLDHLNIPLRNISSKGKLEERILQSVEANIDYQVDQAVERYRDRIKIGKLTIIGTILDFPNSYGRGPGRLIIININGQKNLQQIRNLGVTTLIEPKLKEMVLGRQRLKTIAKKK